MSLITMNLFAPPADVLTHDGRPGGQGLKEKPYEMISSCEYQTKKDELACLERLQKEFQKYSRDPRYRDCEISSVHFLDVTHTTLWCKKR